MAFLQISLPTVEGLAAWAAAASTAGAILPGVVAQVLSESHSWDKHGAVYGVENVEDLWDAFSVLEAVAAACRHVYRQDPSHYPMPRGMEVGIAPGGSVALTWRSDSNTITLRFGGGWSTADLDDRGPNQTPHSQPDMSRACLSIEWVGDQPTTYEALKASPRAVAAVAASPTLQQQGWY